MQKVYGYIMIIMASSHNVIIWLEIEMAVEAHFHSHISTDQKAIITSVFENLFISLGIFKPIA